MVDLSIVVAVYNEEPANLKALLERLRAVIGQIGLTYEVVFVNDGSREATSNALEQIAHSTDYVRLVVLSRNFGQQAAISAGIDHANGRAVVNIDSDLQDPPELIANMVELWKKGNAVVYAKRETRRDRLVKRATASMFYRLLSSLSSIEIPRDCGDFRLIDRQVVSALAEMPEKTRFLRGQIPWLGFKQAAVTVHRGARESGESTYTLKKLLQLAFDGIISFSSAPLLMMPVIGLTVLCLGAIVAFVLSMALAVPAMTVGLVVALVLVFIGVQLTALGVVAIYLAKVLDEVRARPLYLVSKVLGAPTAQSAQPNYTSAAAASQSAFRANQTTSLRS